MKHEHLLLLALGVGGFFWWKHRQDQAALDAQQTAMANAAAAEAAKTAAATAGSPFGYLSMN